MATFEYEGVSIQVDEDGFMEEPEKWNEEVAKALASTTAAGNLAHLKILR